VDVRLEAAPLQPGDDRVQHLVVDVQRRRAQSISAHRELLDRIEQKDPDAAVDAMSRHIAAVNRLLREDEQRDTKTTG
jgi:DNA-binding GntR family transcriptional regulator